MNKISNTKIKIVGAGPTGSLLAISLAKRGCDVTIYDIKTKDELIDRSRAYAINHSSRRILEGIDIWEKINLLSKPFELLYLNDSHLKKSIKFTKSDLAINSFYSDDLGWIIEHNALMKELISQIETIDNIEFNFGSYSNNTCHDNNYDFIIAADGFSSKSSKSKSIKYFKFKYRQSSLTVKVLIRNASLKSSFEILRSEGPFALLPISGDLYQIVWSGLTADCLKRKELSNQLLLNKLSTILPFGYEPDAIVGNVQVFPNYFCIAFPFFEKRYILIGEAAHCFHPVGGQGLNLSWRDVDCLTYMVDRFSRNKRNKLYLPLYYYFKRLPDILLIGFITDSIIRIFSNTNLLPLILRRIIFKVLSLSKIIRKYLFKLMTIGIS